MRADVRKIVGVGLAWGAVWAFTWTVIAAGVRIVDPDSIDPGEPLGMVLVLGPMGLLSGLAFGGLRQLAGRRGPDLDRSIARTAVLGVAGSALVQVAYLGHGDQGLAANVQMALAFCSLGGVVTMAWLLAARWTAFRRAR